MKTLSLATSMLGGLATLAIVGACGDDRGGFDTSAPAFSSDASADAPVCELQCSLDGRSVIDKCTGQVVETCAQERACGAARCQEPCAAAAADESSNGCEFYFQLPRYDPNNFAQSCYASFVVNTSVQPVDLSLELEGMALDVSKAIFRTNPGDATLIPHAGPIGPGESVVLFVSDRDPDAPHVVRSGNEYVSCPEGVVPALVAEHEVRGTATGSSFHLKSTQPVSVTTMYPFGGAKSFLPSATLLLPVAGWRKEHILINAWSETDPSNPAAQIVASEDGTEITIVPTRDIQNGRGVTGTPAKVPATYRLDKGQYLQFFQPEELTGSIVSANKPIATFAAHACAYVLREACDTLHQQIPAFEQWGSEYVGVGYRPRLGSEHEKMLYRIVAAREGTLLEYDPALPPGAPTALSAGEMAMFSSGVGDAFVVRAQDAEHPIYLAAYMTGAGSWRTPNNEDYGGRGDPEFVNVVPAGQYLNSYSFYADPSYGDASLVVVRAKSEGLFKDVSLDCAGNLTDFRPVGSRGDYEYTRVDIMRDRHNGQAECRSGLQRVKSEGPFTATLWGWDAYASYAAPGGMAQRKLVSTPLVPIDVK